MKKWASILAVLAAALIQATLPDYFKIFGAKPEFSLIVLVAMAGFFLFRPRWLIFLALISGIFKDIFSANTFGVNTLLFCCWAILITRVSRKISIEDNLRRAILIFTLALLNGIATGFIAALQGNPLPWGISIRITLAGAFYTLLIAPPILRLIFRPGLKK